MRGTTLIQSIGYDGKQRYNQDNPVELAHEKYLVKMVNRIINTNKNPMTVMYQPLHFPNRGALSLSLLDIIVF